MSMLRFKNDRLPTEYPLREAFRFYIEESRKYLQVMFFSLIFFLVFAISTIAFGYRFAIGMSLVSIGGTALLWLPWGVVKIKEHLEALRKLLEGKDTHA